MKKVTVNAILWLALTGAVVLAGSATAREISKNAGTSAFPFLKINIGARAVAMGGAFTGLADDESALYYNPAGIASFETNRFILEYLNYFEDMQSGFLGYVRKLGNRYALGFQADYLNYGDFVQTDNLGTVTGSFGGGDLLLAVTLAKRQSEDLMFGVTGKFIYEKIQDFSATGLAMDMGVKFERDRGRNTFGLTVQNLGTELSALGTKKDKLPLTVRAGTSLQPKGLPLLIAADLLVPVDNKMVFAIGGEYFHFRPLFLRLGWNSFGSNFRVTGSDDKWAGISLGAGFEIKHGMQLSYSFSPAADLGESHRITLTGSAKW